jgi:hypothetical protein
VTTAIDEISPDYVGEELIVITRQDAEATPRAFNAIVLDIDYSGADIYGGICNPIELMISGPSADSFERDNINHERTTISQRTPPPSVSFRPTEGGRFDITIREVGHNHFWGHLTVDVEGVTNDPGAGQGQDS